jgi:hypothetical protein
MNDPEAANCTDAAWVKAWAWAGTGTGTGAGPGTTISGSTVEE